MFRDVAQLVARVLWEHDVAGSNPVIPTKKEKMTLAVVFSFLLGVSFEADCEAKAGSHTVGITKRSEVTLSFQSSMFATQTESCFAFGECCIPILLLLTISPISVIIVEKSKGDNL